MEKSSKQITVKYLLGTFLFTYLTWGGIIIGQKFGYMIYGEPLTMILYLLGGLSPTIISYIVLRKANAVTFKYFAKDAFAVKQKLSFYMLIPLFLVIYFGLPFAFGDGVIGLPWYTSIAMIPLMMLGGGFEELGWRYILQPALEKKMSFWVATCITATIWSLWHLPLFYIVGTSQQISMTFGVFSISVFGISFALAAIYRISKSIWLCILCHAAANAFSATFVIKYAWKSVLSATVAMMLLSIIIVALDSRRNTQAK